MNEESAQNQMTDVISENENYQKYRGKCKEFSEAACKNDPTLTLVRGHYFCPLWGTNEPHWWTQKPDGTIYDPTKDQFPSKGMGIYTPFDGMMECSECGKRIKEEDADIEGNYAFCSYQCHMRFVGL